MPVTIYQMQNGQLVQLDLGGAAVTVDSALSSTSTNPVQNRAIYAALAGKADTEDLADVAITGSYSDLIDQPDIPNVSSISITLETADGSTDTTADIDLTQDFTLDVPDHVHPAGNISGLATVATSGSYNDLTDTPTIPAGAVVDSALSSTSENPVQNKVINTALNGKADSNHTHSQYLTAHQDISGKADDSAVVHNTGAETVSGVKTFVNAPVIRRVNPYIYFEETDVERGVGPDSGGTAYSGLYFRDKNSDTYGGIIGRILSATQHIFQFYLYDPDGTSRLVAEMKNNNGTVTFTGPTPADGDSSTKLATTAWVNTELGSYLPLSGGTESGAITFTVSDIIKRSLDTQYVRINGGNGNDTGANLILWGPIHSSQPGSFRLRAKDNTNTIDLLGTTAGRLTWAGEFAATNGSIRSETGGVIGLQHAHTNGTELRFGVGTGGSNRGIYQTSGNSHYEGWMLSWDENGIFTLRAENSGSTGRALVGQPAGNLYWGGSAVALAEACYKLGSTNTATTGNVIIRSTATSYTRISGGSANNKGANLLLYGESNSSYAGRFYIYCNDGTTTKNLNGTVGGTLTWNGQTVSTSSDERLKTAFSEVPDEILDAWGKVNWQQFKFIEDAERKGIENCRWHPGLVAQRVKAVFEAEGLDGCRYGILCHEVWNDEYDEDGETLIREAGDQWYVRYEEALAMEAIYQRRRADRLEKRIARLEALLDGDLK